MALGKKEQRIDTLLVEKGLAPSRTRAQSMIMAGTVLVNELRVEKPSESYSADVHIRIKGYDPASKYVGRGGLKLEKALTEFHIRPSGYVCLDVGSSTGGFTDCLLQHGASRVVAVDAGTNQLDWKLRSDERVDVREKTNARFLRPADFDTKFDLIVMDVSFISVTKILPALVPLMKDDGKMLVLIKPQFEAGREHVGKGGVVRDERVRAEAVERVNSFAESLGLAVEGVIESPILGAEGNKEFLSFYEKR